MRACHASEREWLRAIMSSDEYLDLMRRFAANAAHGEEIGCALPPHSVGFLQVEPTQWSSRTLQVLGVPARVKRTLAGYDVLLSAP